MKRFNEKALIRLSILYNIIKKNLKLLIRSKSSASIIILGPIIITLLVSMAFSTSSLYDIKLGIYAPEYNDNVNTLISRLEDKEFKIIKTSSETDCIDKVKESKVHICVVLPADLDLTKDLQREIVFHADYSRINLVWTILDTVTSKISEQSSEWSFNLTVDMLGRIEEARKKLSNERDELSTALQSSSAISDAAGAASRKLSGLNTSFNLESFNYMSLKDAVEDLAGQISQNQNETNESEGEGSGTDIVRVQIELEKLEAKLNQTVGDMTTVNAGLQDSVKSLSSISQDSSAAEIKLKSVEQAFKEVDESIGSLTVKNATTIVNPLLTSIKPISTGKTNLDYVIATLVVLVIMLIAVLLSSATVMAEKTSKAYFRRYIASTPEYIYMLATYITVMLIMVIQLAIFIAISHFFLKTGFSENIFVLTIVLLIITTFFTLAGMTIGYLFNSEETSAIAAISFSSISIFFSNTILPIENMPNTIQQIALFNPFVLSHSVLNKAFLFHANLAKLIPEIYILLGYALGLIILIVIIQMVNRARMGK